MHDAPTAPPFFEVVVGQRACRAFDDDRDVADETLAILLEAATHAPSAENRQPWVFVVIRDAETRARVGELTAQAWEDGARELSRRRLAEELFTEVDEGATGGISAAPVLVVVGADTDRCLDATVASSTFPAVQNLLLAAQALGLGSALTTLPTVHADELGAAVGLPETVVPVAVVPLGYPARPLGPPRREHFAGHTHRERFGQPW